MEKTVNKGVSQHTLSQGVGKLISTCQEGTVRESAVQRGCHLVTELARSSHPWELLWGVGILGWKSKPYFFSTKITYLFTFSQSPFSPHRVVCDRQADREYVQGGVGGGHLSPFYLSEIFKVITNRIGVGITSPGGRYYSSHSVFFPAQSGQASTSSTQLSRGSLSVHQGWHSTWYLVTPSC